VLAAVRKGKYTLSGPRWDSVSDLAKDFIRKLLVYNPAKRMTAELALKHPWLLRAKHESSSRPLDPEVLENLRAFAKAGTFKRAALEAVAFSMSAQSIKHLREQFSKLDKDQSGFVSVADFMDALITSGVNKVEAKRIFDDIDTAHTNHISYTEFLAASLSRRLWYSRERIRDAFQRLDVDGTGFITADNLKELLGDDWTPDKAAAMMREADTKGAGAGWLAASARRPAAAAAPTNCPLPPAAAPLPSPSPQATAASTLTNFLPS
jgi:calcium-dependent protein kinase